ncbi:hypothetical protein [Sphingomonas sp. KC8]|uniref:hypothetical protein n=1 Tax=Sphingomonas sp. KC8 TaxID=1030157 RepID=UPI0002EED795|nr:hypothetical protein [Sphingomonas sp. KC8]ARS28824.1 hypothetical protein KC8_16220 [Sphingomonas sp. KC8]
MSRAMNLNATVADVTTTCRTLNIATTAIEALIPEGTRVVCQTSEGAIALRAKMRTKVISGAVVRAPRFVAASSMR